MGYHAERGNHQERSVGPRRTDIHVLTALSRHPCRSTHCASSTFGLHPSRVLWCLDCRAQEQRWLELTLLAFLVRVSISCAPLSLVGARLPAICREPAVNPAHAVCQASSSRLILLPLRGRSRDKPRSYRDCVNLTLIVPTLRVVTQRLTLRVNVDAARPGRRSHAERGNDQPISSALRYLWETSEVTRAWAAIRTNAVGQVPRR